ncbi:HNH endonuclease [Novosphingobium sp. BW1]|uniref:HNH endonuclease n=1 Tax=Novosphingobium sp. BW1 TaxID=2592621 RepID=UPI0011DE59E2|nr:HNH endonuclease [Novosphingobium sp. BW1]TYC93016.1 HNH endonuclease [Novosphingobium sp. BW1]
MKGRAIPYSTAEMAWLEANKTLSISDYHAAFQQRFGRADVTAANLHALRKRKGWRTGRSGFFVKGQEPVNKGKKCAPGKGGLHPNSRRTQFKKGQMSGTAQHNYKPIGYERITEDGYVERKISDTGAARQRWRAVHLLNWEATHGPLPEGHALKCLDGNKQNTEPGNWELVHRGVLARLNGGRFRKTLPYDQAPAELKPTVMAVAKLKHAVSERRRA